MLSARGLLFPWVPVCLGAGIGGYFALPSEPGPLTWAACLSGAAAALAAWRLAPAQWHPVAAAVALVLAGVLLAGARAHWCAAPVLRGHYYGAVQGRVVALDRSSADRVRLTLDRVILDGIAPGRTPARVRVSLHGAGAIVPGAGQVVLLTAHLSPPAGPAEPGGFDFRRAAWFERLGAVGYTRAPVVLWRAAKGRRLTRVRLALAQAIRHRIGGDAGAFAAAVVTGDRSGIGQRSVDDLRAANLAHLLAISGLHMGLLTGFVFAVLRLGLSLIPPLALRLPVKKIAAAVALVAGAVYLALSGGNIATQRAFVMVAVMLGAVLLDRRALTLRSVAVAATILLVARPESLTQPGFQMSFAATTALVAAFAGLRGPMAALRGPWVMKAALTLVLSSAVAGTATAPIAAATFNRIAAYGLLANVLAVPVMGLAIMPAAVLAAVLAPLGLANAPLWVMGAGARWILAAAHWVAALDGAVVPVPRPPGTVLPMLVLGALWLILLRGGPRWLGPGAMVAALVLWATASRPVLLVSGDGRLAGVMTPAGRALSRPGGSAFAARSWLDNDGDAATQRQAAGRRGFRAVPGGLEFRAAGLRGVVLQGAGQPRAARRACAAGSALIVMSVPDTGPRPPATACLILDRRLLAKTGAVALELRDGRPVLKTVAQMAGRRPWTAPHGAPPGRLRLPAQ